MILRSLPVVALGVLLLAIAPASAEELPPFETQVVKLPGIPERFEFNDGKVSLGRLRVRLADGSWVRLVNCGESLCAEPLEKGRAEPRLPKGALPGSAVARGARNIRQAWLADPVLRLGSSEPVAAKLVAIDPTNRRHELDLALDAAFIGPRLQIADADGDGEDEIVLEIGEEGHGRSLAIVELRQSGIAIASRTRDAADGLTSIVLGPVADLDGDGVPETSFLNGRGDLEIWRYREGRLDEAFVRSGLSAEAPGPAAADVTGDAMPDLIVPSEERLTLQVLSILEDELIERARIALPAAIVTVIEPIALQGRKRPVLLLGTADGSLVIVR
jgi:hypothetical protein